MSIFGSIASSVAGGFIGAIADPITKITGQIADAKVKLEQAKNDKERLAAEERVKTLEAKRDVLVAQAASGDRTASLIQALFALAVLVWLVKRLVFDTALHQWTGWTTPALPEELEPIVLAVIGFYFVDIIAGKFRR